MGSVELLKIILDFVSNLIWPGVVVFVLVYYRDAVTAMAERVDEAVFPGGRVSLRRLVRSASDDIEEGEKELEELNVPALPSGTSLEVHAEAATGGVTVPDVTVTVTPSPADQDQALGVKLSMIRLGIDVGLAEAQHLIDEDPTAAIDAAWDAVVKGILSVERAAKLPPTLRASGIARVADWVQAGFPSEFARAATALDQVHRRLGRPQAATRTVAWDFVTTCARLMDALTTWALWWATASDSPRNKPADG